MNYVKKRNSKNKMIVLNCSSAHVSCDLFLIDSKGVMVDAGINSCVSLSWSGSDDNPITLKLDEVNDGFAS